ncbi:hypothetical protein [Echinicola sp. 20G]|uniref:hypothetical protein n=1 Tax=Echinicola sp. 20G TaxID=2781961 RepID=UPI0019100012|nr:hypothetical protein [Echinicola sp. 20G]
MGTTYTKAAPFSQLIFSPTARKYTIANIGKAKYKAEAHFKGLDWKCLDLSKKVKKAQNIKVVSSMFALSLTIKNTIITAIPEPFLKIPIGDLKSILFILLIKI